MMSERTLKAEVKLYYDVDLPASDGPRPPLLALHGYGGSKRQIMREARQMAPEGWAVVALQGLHQHIRQPPEKGQPLRFGFGWLTNFDAPASITLHHQFITQVIQTLTDEGTIDPQHVFLLGFSQTCALNFRFAFTYPQLLRGIVGMCGGIPGDWATNSVYQNTDAEVFYLHGVNDEFYPPERTALYAEALRQRARVTARAYNAGHDFTSEMREDVRQWLQERAN